MKLSIHGNIEIDDQALADFCRRWKVAELSLFGSVLRDDFGPDSDVDILVVFEPNAPWSYWDWPDMIDQLKQIFGRDVDLIEKTAIRNPFRRQLVLENHRVMVDRHGQYTTIVSPPAGDCQLACDFAFRAKRMKPWLK